MRYLILSCNTGEGHNSAAKAVTDAFNDKNIECVTKDALAFWSPETSKLISKGHVFLYRRLPKLFGVSYRFEENHPPKDGDESLIYELVIKGCDALYEHIMENDYSGIMCTHVFSSMMVTELKKRHDLKIKSYFIATDYTCSPGVSETRLDTYFIPHRLLTDEFAANGIPEEKLYPCGIPVRGGFYSKTTPDAAKRHLGLPEDKKIVMLTCGSMGCGPIKELTEYLPHQLDSNSMLVVICGNNRKLYKSLTKYPLPQNVKIVVYTTRMSLYMDAASLILTKPGGLSTTEAAVKALPMVFIDAVPGCETRNIEFFLKNGFADMRNSAIELCDLVCEYLENPEKLSAISKKLRDEFNTNAADSIRDYVLNTTKGSTLCK